VQGVCPVCGKPFSGAANRRFCGDKCRWHHYRNREREVQLSVPYRLTAVYEGSCGLFLDEDGCFWIQLTAGVRGPKEGEPGRPEKPATMIFDANYLAQFRSLAGEAGQ
jgi:predicted nucleic acid-binding Zn ribbon protein